MNRLLAGGKNFSNERFTGLHVSDLSLAKRHFQQCVFDRCEFRNCQMDRCTFQECKIENSTFIRSILRKTWFKSCDIRQSFWSHISGKGLKFEQCQIRDVDIERSDISAGSVRDSILMGINLSHSDMNRIRMDSSSIEELSLVACSASKARLKKLHGTRWDVCDSTLVRIRVDELILNDTHIQDTEMKKGRVTNLVCQVLTCHRVDLRHGIFSDVRGDRFLLDSCRLESSRWVHSHFSGKIQNSDVNLQEVSLVLSVDGTVRTIDGP